MKTAELFALACELGALLSGAPSVKCEALRQFGIAFGTAYQVFDDCLDVFGNEESAGKTLGTDLATGKVTLPLLLTHQRASPADRATLWFARLATTADAGVWLYKPLATAVPERSLPISAEQRESITFQEIVAWPQ